MNSNDAQRTLIERIEAVSKALSIDAAMLAGVGLVVFGINMIHPPSAFIVGGLILIALSVLAARRAG